MLPKKNEQYSNSDFWEKRYQNETQREWLGDYSMFSKIFNENVKKNASILILGCGNSLLSEQLFDDGYTNIHNIDISSSVIKQMSQHCHKCKQLKWSIMDCRHLTFPDQSFDVVLEKATLDVFLVAEKSPWNVSDEAIQLLQPVADGIKRVLKRNHGQFFSITFSAAHFRQPLLERIFQNHLKIKQVKTLGSDFHFYLYHLLNDPSTESIPYFKYEPPTAIKDQSKFIENDLNIFSD